MLSQKKEIKRTARAREKLQAELHDAATQQDEEARQCETRDFELTQAGLLPNRGETARAAVNESRPGGKRKLMPEDDTADESSRDHRAKSRKVTVIYSQRMFPS